MLILDTLGAAFSDVVVGNSRAQYGGAMLVQGSSSVSLGNDSWLAGNSAEHGGALFVSQAASVYLEHTKLFSNNASLAGGAVLVRDEGCGAGRCSVRHQLTHTRIALV